MSALGERGITTIWTMWMFSAISSVVVALRLFTRIHLLHSQGWDDYFYALSWILLILYTIFMTIASLHGFGRHISELELEDSVQAVYYAMIGQTFAVVGMAIAKVSIGFFLLRLVIVHWHKASLWLAIISIFLLSVVTGIIFWMQCIPSRAIYDPRVKGSCHVKVEGIAIALGAWCAFEDFFFALFPLFIIAGLQMRFKEKLTVGGGLSLGVIAGICGIFRTRTLTGFNTADYTYDTFELIVWSGAELCLTLVCAGVAVLRSLYKVVRRQESSRSRGYQQQSSSSKPNGQPRSHGTYPMHPLRHVFNREDSREIVPNNHYLNNDSKEIILGPELGQEQIKKTTEFAVRYSSEEFYPTDVDNMC